MSTKNPFQWSTYSTLVTQCHNVAPIRASASATLFREQLPSGPTAKRQRGRLFSHRGTIIQIQRLAPLCQLLQIKLARTHITGERADHAHYTYRGALLYTYDGSSTLEASTRQPKTKKFTVPFLRRRDVVISTSINLIGTVIIRDLICMHTPTCRSIYSKKVQK